MVHIGVDLHRKRSHVAALDNAGELLLSRRIDSTPEALFRVFGAQFRSSGSRTCG